MIFGACSGNCLLGNHLGSCVTTEYGEAVGCTTLNINAAGQHDKLLGGFPAETDVLLGHQAAGNTTPDGAILLMTGSNYPVLKFRLDENVYATQFHLWKSIIAGAKKEKTHSPVLAAIRSRPLSSVVFHA